MRSHQLMFAGVSSLALVSAVTGGSLTPPAGPIAPTMKTLTELEPRLPLSQLTAPGDATNQFRITQPGSYYLTGNLTGVSGKTCISFASSGVTLDLNGFTIQGVAGSLSGVRVGSNDCAVRNGNVRDFSVGVDAYEAIGIRLQNLSATSHDNDGIRASRGAVIEGCVATSCGGDGFDVFESVTLSNCTAVSCSIGFNVAGAAVLTNCTANGSSTEGFRLQESAVLTDCTAFDSTGAGFVATARCRLTRCNSRSNQYGFFLTEANAVVECTASSNSSNGVYIAGNANAVERSTCHENTGSGIYVASGAGNNIDGNLLTYNGLNGLNVSTAANLAVRNRARGNIGGNYMFNPGADYGVILSNPGQAFTSSSAWANFAY